MDGEVYNSFELIKYGNSPALKGNTVNKAIFAALKAINEELPEEARTVGNFKGIIKDCENLLDDIGLVSLRLL